MYLILHFYRNSSILIFLLLVGNIYSAQNFPKQQNTHRKLSNIMLKSNKSEYSVCLYIDRMEFEMDIIKKLESKDGSIKYLFELEDKNTIETLYMHDIEQNLTYHSTVCVSSQVGCSLGCAFCATGKQGYVRDLTADEIVNQVSACNSHCISKGITPIDAVVFAGMGEPLLNYENVKSSIYKIISDLDICNFEIVTVGIIPFIYKLIEDFKDNSVKIRLNLSLHASTNELRKKLIPYSLSNDLENLLNAATDYTNITGTKSRLRYTLFKGLNDTPEDIERLSKMLEGKPIKLIVSNYNDNNIPNLQPSEPSDIVDFCEKLKPRIDCGVFHNFGGDIKGGCGQLYQHKPDFRTPIAQTYV
jgi:23S rRNA (adenine2503-C2)-methyltransferase